MSSHLFTALAVISLCSVACAQTDTSFLIAYAANLNAGDSVVNITNTGASSTNICVNVFTFGPDEQVVSDTPITVSPNGLLSCSVRDLVSNPLFPEVLTSAVIKLVATQPCSTPAGGTTCDSCPLRGNLATGMAAWRTTLHAAPSGTFAVTETPFSRATLSDGELGLLEFFRNFIRAQGSGSGISPACRAGGR
jgi:hypothetical protein